MVSKFALRSKLLSVSEYFASRGYHVTLTFSKVLCSCSIFCTDVFECGSLAGSIIDLFAISDDCSVEVRTSDGVSWVTIDYNKVYRDAIE